jgi:Chemotaxis signal transduction protein
MDRGEVEMEDALLEADEDTQADKYLCFRLGEESYGLDIRCVTEIIEMQRISAVPDMPKAVRGVINLRGSVIPVLDLRLRFGMPERAYDDRTCVIVSELRGLRVGLIVDTVEEVVEIPAGDIEPAPRMRTESGEARYISGIGKACEKVKILLDVDKVVGEDVADASDGGSHA